MDLLTEPLTHAFFVRALIAASLVGIVCAVVGTFVVLKGLAFIGDAISHAAFPGVVAAYIVHGPILVGAGIAAVETAVARIRSGQSDHMLVGGDFNAENADMLLGYELGGYLHRAPWKPVWQRAGSEGGGVVSGSGGVSYWLVTAWVLEIFLESNRSRSSMFLKSALPPKFSW
jgi:acetyl-CoA acetyltransferase